MVYHEKRTHEAHNEKHVRQRGKEETKQSAVCVPLLARTAKKKRRAERKTAQTYRGRCRRGATTTVATSTLQNVGKTTKSTRETKGKRGNKTERCVWHTSGVAAAAAGGPLPRAGSPATPSACAAQAHTRTHAQTHERTRPPRRASMWEVRGVNARRGARSTRVAAVRMGHVGSVAGERTIAR